MRQLGLVLWRKIMMEWSWLKGSIQWKLDRGNKIRFWQDSWVEGGSLMSRFSLIFAISQSRNMVSKEAFNKVNGNRECVINVTKNLNDWEISEYEALMQLLAAQHINAGLD